MLQAFGGDVVFCACLILWMAEQWADFFWLLGNFFCVNACSITCFRIEFGILFVTIVLYFCQTEVLTTIFSLPHGEFLSSWCSSELPVWEEDATLEYDPCAAAGWALEFFSSSDLLYPCCLESTFIPCNVPRASYAHQRTSLLVKVIANLHCFVPDICKGKHKVP